MAQSVEIVVRGRLMIFRCLAVWLGLMFAARHVAPVMAADSCPPQTGTIQVSFQTRSPPPAYNNTLNVTGIRNMFVARGTAVAELMSTA